MNKINVQSNTFKDQKILNEVTEICKRKMEMLSELGPSDNDTVMSLQKNGQKFFVTLQMMSSGLAFTLQTRAYSPFMAIELAIKEAMQKVEKWSAVRATV